VAVPLDVVTISDLRMIGLLVASEAILAVVDKTVKVTGGSQMDVQKEIDNTILHLCNDPLKRKYLILLGGAFFYEYVQENKGKCENIFFSTTDELINTNKEMI
jgi:hypothetical protein